jgi:hypothetical protein
MRVRETMMKTVRGSMPGGGLAAAVLAAVLLLAGGAGPADAASGPLYAIKSIWGNTNLPPGGEGQFVVQARNIGDAVGSEDLTITDELPAGVTVTGLHWSGPEELTSFCSGVGTETATCILPASLLEQNAPPPSLVKQRPVGYLPPIFIDVAIDPAAAGSAINTATISGGGDQPRIDSDQVFFNPTPSTFDVVPGSFKADVFDAPLPFGVPVRQAGDHPFEQRVDFDITTNSGLAADGTRYVNGNGLLRTVEVTLPRGMIGNPEAVPKCDPVDFTQPGAGAGSLSNSTGCPSNTQVGYLNVTVAGPAENYGRAIFFTPNEIVTRVALYNLEPPRGVPADFGFNGGGLVQGHIYPELDPSQNYAIKTVSPNITAIGVKPNGAEVVFWGVPGDPAHDNLRYYPRRTDGMSLGAPWGSAPIRPLLTNPADCGFDNGAARIRAGSYAQPDQLTPVQEASHPLNVTGCDDPRFRFEPEIAMQPSDRHAGAPTGLDVHLKVPQRDDKTIEPNELYAKNGFVKGISTPPMKKVIVTFPEGMTLSPSAAQGLGSCTPAEIGIGTNAPVTCPDNSQYGTLTLHTPILPVINPPTGFIYIAKQGDNPFHNFLSIYLVIEEPERGILVKVPGRIDLDPTTGQITTTFDELPQFPISDMEMTFKGGVRAGLVNPSTCGQKTIAAEFFSWQEPATVQKVENSYNITERPDGSPCPKTLAERSFKPSLEAGMLSNAAGSYSPFLFRLTRGDDDQEFSQLGVTLPAGLTAKFAGVSSCSNAAITQAERRTGAGDGLLEQTTPSCPASSQIGTTQVGTGVGVPLTYVPGKVYLAGPYNGAPISMVVISPAIIGPYDLGVIAVRTALKVDPVTAQASAFSDPFPQIFQGIPVRIRDIRLNLDRSGFTLNPTSCVVKQIDAKVTGTGGDVASQADDTSIDLQNRFQAADCASLPFKPALSFRLFGGTKRGSHPKLQAILRGRAGDANIAGASVVLPHSEFLDQAHIRTVCTRVQFAARSCPAASIYGFASAKTPLFDRPLQGPVYLRSSSHTLPDLVAALRGPDTQPIEVNLSGRIDSVKGGIRNTFEIIPDAPVSEFKLSMQGGKKGLLVNSTSLCAKTRRATAKFTAQNGKRLTLHPKVVSACGKKKQKHRRSPHHQARH